MPKEHYPIMPLIPPETFKHLFRTTRNVSMAIKTGLVHLSTQIFIANGGAAGQQSQHFMLHVVPRDESDGLVNFDIKEGLVEVDEAVKNIESIKQNLGAIMKSHNTREGHGMPAQEAPSKFDKTQVLKILNANPKLIGLIKKDPVQFKAIIPTSADLTALFNNVDADEIIEEITGRKLPKGNEGKGKKDKDEESYDKEGKKSEEMDEEEEPDESSESEKADLDKISGLFK